VAAFSLFLFSSSRYPRLCEGPTITCTFVHKRQHIRKKKKKKKRKGRRAFCRAAALINEEDLSLLRYGLLQKGSRLLQKRKRRKTEEEKKQGREREAAVRRREREKNRVFLTATSIRDWGFVCGPILMKF
jgi:hypothetical protein